MGIRTDLPWAPGWIMGDCRRFGHSSRRAPERVEATRRSLPNPRPSMMEGVDRGAADPVQPKMEARDAMLSPSRPYHATTPPWLGSIEAVGSAKSIPRPEATTEVSQPRRVDCFAAATTRPRPAQARRASPRESTASDAGEPADFVTVRAANQRRPAGRTRADSWRSCHHATITSPRASMPTSGRSTVRALASRRRLQRPAALLVASSTNSGRPRCANHTTMASPRSSIATRGLPSSENACASDRVLGRVQPLPAGRNAARTVEPRAESTRHATRTSPRSFIATRGSKAFSCPDTISPGE